MCVAHRQKRSTRRIDTGSRPTFAGIISSSCGSTVQPQIRTPGAHDSRRLLSFDASVLASGITISSCIHIWCGLLQSTTAVTRCGRGDGAADEMYVRLTDQTL